MKADKRGLLSHEAFAQVGWRVGLRSGILWGAKRHLRKLGGAKAERHLVGWRLVDGMWGCRWDVDQ